MRRILTLLVISAMALTACAADVEVAGPTELSNDSGGEVLIEATDGEAPAEGEVRVDLDVTEGREVIRRASLQLHAADTRDAFERIVEMVEASGGFVANANVAPTNGDDDAPAISLTLRVPADQLTNTMTAIKGTADDVLSETQSAEDVTEQFIDLEARLTNLQALEVELRALLTEVRAREDADPDEILRVFNEVSSVRGQIEQLQGKINYLSDLTALATLDVGITQTPAAAPLVEDPWSPAEVARTALGKLVAGLQGVADWAINFAIYVLPILLIVVGPLTVLGLFVHRRFFRRAEPTPTNT